MKLGSTNGHGDDKKSKDDHHKKKKKKKHKKKYAKFEGKYMVFGEKIKKHVFLQKQK